MLKIDNISSIEYQAVQTHMADERRSHFYRGMKVQEYHQYYDECYRKLVEKTQKKGEEKDQCGYCAIATDDSLKNFLPKARRE